MRNLDDVISGLQLKLHGLKQVEHSDLKPKMTSVTSEQPREVGKGHEGHEGRGEGQIRSMTDVLATSDFKNALRKFSQRAENSAIEVGLGSSNKYSIGLFYLMITLL